ncbi:MAG: D-mannonate epimerase, partial [Acidobacteria bacterium]|nr:D-mannonate epimerase [Acidobacteriota bacterium]
MMELSYENSKKILNEWVKSESLLNHAKGVEIAMRAYAKKFGEDDKNDELIRKYGYVGKEKVLELVKQNDDLQGNLS